MPTLTEATLSFLYLLHKSKVKHQKATAIGVQTPASSHPVLGLSPVLPVFHVIPKALFSYRQYLRGGQSPYKFLIQERIGPPFPKRNGGRNVVGEHGDQDSFTGPTSGSHKRSALNMPCERQAEANTRVISAPRCVCQ